MEDPGALIERAEAQVDAVDWQTWTPHPSDTVLMPRIGAGVPPLTRGIVTMFVDFQTWLAARPATQEDHASVEQRMVGAWLMSDREGMFIRDVLVALAVRQELLGMPAEDREAIRPALRARFEESARTGAPAGGRVADARREGSPEESLADHMRRSAIQHEMFLNTLNSM